MRFFSKLSFVLALTAPLTSHAFAADKIVSLEVSIDDAALIKKDAGIRTLFIILYDADSPRPMPYGAVKVDLREDAKGAFYKGDLTSENIQTMGGGPVPKNLRLKARLDKDGSAGMDQPGDLVGTVEKAKAGETVKIKIAKAI
ncbi:MAG: hypothetical protein H7318_09815 [Oligoflexus sp.]|nr:hypothetical protein [Oligoflexus sp.]